MNDAIMSLLAARQGHFLLESGHHGTLWLDLELLFLRPRQIRPLAVELARRLSSYNIDAVCGPLVEGAFVAQMVAEELDVAFAHAEPAVNSASDGLYPVHYRIPPALRPTLQHKSVAIVNDVINAGSAVRGTFADLEICGARPVAVAALLVLGKWTSEFVREHGLTLESLAELPNEFWAPANCPLCAAGMPLDAGLQPRS